MTQDASNRPRGFGLTIAAFALAFAILGAINLWRWLEARRSAVAAFDVNGDVDAAPTADAGPADEGVRRQAASEAGPGDRASTREEESQGFATGDSVEAQETDPTAYVAAGAPPDAAGAAGGAGLEGPSVPGPPAPDDAVVPSPGAAAAAGAVSNLPSEKAPAAQESRTPEEASLAGDDPSSDRTGPVLGHLRFEPGVVEGGSATTLTIQATDPLSGVKSVRGEIQSPSGKASLPLWMQESQDGRSFTYVVNIPTSAEAGVWYVKWLHLTDVANNSSLVQAASAAMAPPGGTFSVSSSESDSIAPEVVEISFEKDTIGDDEDRNLIQVEVHDDLSGVASVNGVCRSLSGSALIPFTCALNPDSGLWEGTILIPEHAACGEWSLQQLSAKDKAGNITHLTAESRNLGHAGFTVAPREDCDSSPPTLESLELSPTVVPGDTANEIRITAVVRDVGTGVASLSGWFEGPVSEGGQVTRSDFTCVPDPGNPEAPWTGTLMVPRFSAKGSWKVRLIELKDKAMNVREYVPGHPVLSAGVFEVR